MKNAFLILVFTVFAVFTSFSIMAQSTTTQSNKKIQYFRSPGLDGLNVFETPKTTDVPFNGLKVRIGGDFAIQFQAISHSNTANNLVDLGNNFNLPTANLNLDVQLADGMRMSMTSYLSSRHHNETWVKGGYLQIDKLDFIKKGFLDNIMKFTTIRAGVDEPNYGDAHFRRSDNAAAMYNPFVGNYIMDAFTTEPFLEFNFQPSHLIIVAGVSNGMLDPTVMKTTTNRSTGEINGTSKPGADVYGKLGYDNKINDNLRVRLTGSVYASPNYDVGGNLYHGDRAGGRYYDVMDYIKDSVPQADAWSGRLSPGFSSFTSIMINPFVKFYGLEFFGMYEMTSGDKADAPHKKGGSYNQIGAELLYRFGSHQQLYVGGRYNTVSGKATSEAKTTNISRINVGGGWYMTNNVLVKVEYVDQQYTGDGYKSYVQFNGGKFSGGVLEAVVGF